MSHDEIVFGDVTYREPERKRRPDRDPSWAALAYEVPGPGDLPIFLDRQPADAIERHALRDTSVELGGILLGKECLDDQTGEPFVWVTKSLEAKHFENTQASFTYTHDSWEEITRERDRLHPELDIVGWYHTHPDFGIFLSSHDLFIHRNFFAQPLQVAYVVDPIRQTRGFFQWREGGLNQVGGFHITAQRNERVPLARQVNDLENIPNTDEGRGPDGAFSPRLEAELIAMLTRPATHHAAPADRAQTAALFGLIGALAGTLGLAAVLWLHHLGNQVQDQADTIKDLEKTVGHSADTQRLALDTLLDKASGNDAEKFVERYKKTADALDDSRRQLANQATINDALATRAKELQLSYAKLRTDYEIASKYENDAKEAATLRAKVGRLESDAEALTKKAAELDALLETAEGSKAAGLLRKYERAWYAAAAGWAVSLVSALGLIVSFITWKLPEEPEAPPAPGPTPPGPTHRIT